MARKLRANDLANGPLSGAPSRLRVLLDCVPELVHISAARAARARAMGLCASRLSRASSRPSRRIAPDAPARYAPPPEGTDSGGAPDDDLLFDADGLRMGDQAVDDLLDGI